MRPLTDDELRELLGGHLPADELRRLARVDALLRAVAGTSPSSPPCARPCGSPIRLVAALSPPADDR